MDQEIKAIGFFSKYPFKNYTNKRADILYSGSVFEIQEEYKKLDVVEDQVESGQRFIIIYQTK